MLSDASVIYKNAFLKGIKPDPLITVSEWADKNRYLSQTSSAEPGRWRTARTPYLKEIMDELSNTSLTERVVFKKASQIGGSECGFNWIGYIISVMPGPLMCVNPTSEMAKRVSKQRIDPLIESSPVVRERVKPQRERDSGNTQTMKSFPNGILVMAGANSATGLRSLPAKFLMLDEIDAYPTDLDGEGSPVELAEKRTATFPRRKIFIVSTPTIEGRSAISAAYDETDQRRYFVPCPFCKELQVLEWAQVRWPEGEPRKATYGCKVCSASIEEHRKTWMLENGRWISTNPNPASKNTAGFHLSSLYSPVGWFSWGEAAEVYLRAKKSEEALRTFVNTYLGETWKEKGEAPDWKRLYERREPYKVGTIPKGVVFLTCGVDIQKNRIEAEVVGWGRDKQSYSIEYVVLNGDTTDPDSESWQQLDALLSRVYLDDRGLEYRIKIMAVDTGYNTQRVYDWVRRKPFNQVMAVKGRDQTQHMVSTPTSVDVKVNGKKIKRGLRVWSVGVSIIKSELYSWLNLEKPTADSGRYPAGYCHFPEYDEEYFKMLTAEQINVRIVKGFRRYEWQKSRERNESLDCRVYARAAAAVVGMDRFKDAQWDNLDEHGNGLIEDLEVAGKDGVALAPRANPLPAPVKQTRRRTSFI